jgi:3-oxoadipate enol-lactonase
VTSRDVVTAQGVRLHSRTDGDDALPALLLLNSLGTDLSMWDPQVPAWTAHRRVLRFDQRGHGRSDVPPGQYTVEQLGADAIAVLDAHGVETVDVCGISLGGLVALWLAAAAPDRVRRLVLADTAARVGTRAAWQERVDLVRRGGMAAITDLVISRFFSEGFRASDNPVLERVASGLQAMSPEGYAASCELLAVTDLHHAAAAARAPTLVIVGSEDLPTPPEDARDLAARIPGARLVELPGAGHLANLEQPEDFARAVADFLAMA